VFDWLLPILGGNGLSSSMCNPILTLFYGEKRSKSRSPLKRRRESVASSPHIKLSSAKLPSTSEILFLRSQMLRTARYGVLYKITVLSAQVLFFI